jgi:para-aminobenzoate synthetase component 1
MTTGSALPLARRVALHDPLVAFQAVASLPDPFLLHSSLEGATSRWSFFGADPFSTYRGGDYAGGVAAFRRLARRASADAAAGHAAPFTGGAVGYWSYDFGRRLEALRVAPGERRAVDDLGLPDFLLGFYDVIGAIDHEAGETWLFSSGLPLDGDRRRAHAERRLERFVWLLERAAPLEADESASTEVVPATSNFHADEYRRSIERVREYIRRGDLFQANLSQRWTLPHASPDPEALAFRLHRAAARRSPAPYAALLGCGDHAVVSASPERFLERRGRTVTTRPIKGTRPRHAEPAEDARLAAELMASAKDRAENVMIVDVLRNDLGRVCETGSVTVPELCALESFPQVHHLTSTVAGRLAEGRDAFDLLHACFPGGSITGAPKIRAMEILDTLEPQRRHLYTGSIGYVDWRGDADWNIAIRTAIVTGSAIHFAAGGGITEGSDPDDETIETLHKAEGLRAALSELLGPVELESGGVLAE